ncbi:MAG TPA: AAA family ATPase, partial [Nitrospiraceae bacterium]|nr:AAA family ATPase [Nitrospiraceae bacterium]
NCAFCGSVIPGDRWEKLDEHFDKESEKLESDIIALVARIETEKSTVSTALSINKDNFYSRFHDKLDELDGELKDAIERYCNSLDVLATQLADRKDDILSKREFTRPDNTSSQLDSVWGKYDVIRDESNSFSSSLDAEQTKARQVLRLKEVSDYLVTIRYAEQISALESHKRQREAAEQAKRKIEDEIRAKEELLSSKRRELNDEEKGAKKVNEYLNNFFGHRFLSLQARKSEPPGEEQRRIRFEVIRDGKKAYHLSEGECSLLAFCYFLAKLNDTETWDEKPIIWVDDPISSLDGNHIFFLFSLLRTEIVSKGKFEQLFVSTHNLEFLKYLKRLNGSYVGSDGKPKGYQKAYFVVARQDKNSIIKVMPKYLKEYVTEFNYLFHQIYKSAAIEAIDDTNYKVFYSFGNNARKFLEIYLYYRYPDDRPIEEKLGQFFGEDNVPAVLTDRINNEYSHLCGVFERGSLPVEVPEMQTVARQIIERLMEDEEQYSALLKSVGEPVEDKVPT